MNEQRRQRISNILLWVALVAMGVAAVALMIERRLSFVSEIAFGVAGALLLTFIILEPVRTRTWITSRQVRYGSNAVMMSLLLLAVLGVANFLADRHPYRVDVTANRRLSLAPQTVDLLRTLEGPVRVVAFFPNSEGKQAALDLFDQYRYHYPQWEVETHDPFVEPSQAQQWGVTESWRPTVFILYGERQETIHEVSEVEVTSALVRLTRSQNPVVYFLTGHGELELNDAGQTGLSTLRSRLESEGFTVRSLNLLITTTVPADASVVALVGPQRPLAQGEVDRLAEYADRGGSLMILLDPTADAEMDSSPLADWLAQRWGGAFRRDIVIEQTANFPGCPYPACPVIEPSSGSPIGGRMQDTFVYLLEARSIHPVTATLATTATQPTYTPLLQSSRDSWGETSLDTAQYNEDVDVRGPLDLAVTVEDPDSGARLALFGDCHFVSNVSVRDLWNSDLVVNTLDWFTQDETLISIRPREDVERHLTISSGLVLSATFVFLVILVPLAVVGIGLLVFAARRWRR